MGAPPCNLQDLKDLLLGARYHRTASEVLWGPCLNGSVLFCQHKRDLMLWLLSVCVYTVLYLGIAIIKLMSYNTVWKRTLACPNIYIAALCK